MRNETREILTLFVETAHQLAAYRFAKYVENGGKFRVTLRGGIPDKDEVEIEIPDDEDMRAFALTFRLFVQDSDGISFRALASLRDDGLSEEWRTRYAETRAWLHAYLAQKTNVVLRDGSTPDFLEVRDVFLYGGLAHLDLGKRAKLNFWKEDKGVFALFQQDFNAILMQMFYVIKDVAIFTEQELRGEKVYVPSPSDNTDE